MFYQMRKKMTDEDEERLKFRCCFRCGDYYIRHNSADLECPSIPGSYFGQQTS